MRIAIIAGSIPTTTFIDGLINGMAERGYTMIVIGKRTRAFNYFKGVECIEVPKQKIRQLLFVLFNLRHISFRNLRALFKNATSSHEAFYDLLFYLPIFKSKPDKVHIQWASSLYKKMLLFDFFPDKILLSLRGAHINYTPIIKPEIGEYYTMAFPKVHKFHAVSKAIAMEATKYNAELSKIQIIYSFIDPSLLNYKTQTHKHRQKLRVISIGRFHWKKGYEYALDALYEVKKRNIDFEYTIVAQGNIPESISFQIHQLGLAENVKIINGLSQQEVFQEISKHDLFLLPSIEEGIANVVLESMAIGVPVISTNCGGMSEVITDNQNGFLVEVRDTKHLASKILEFQTLSEERKSIIIENAKDSIRKAHSKELFLEQYIKFILNS